MTTCQECPHIHTRGKVCETCSILDDLICDTEQTLYDVILKDYKGKIVEQAYDILPADLYEMQYGEQAHQSLMTWIVTDWRIT